MINFQVWPQKSLFDVACVLQIRGAGWRVDRVSDSEREHHIRRQPQTPFWLPPEYKGIPGRGMSGKKMQEMSGIWADSLANSAQSPYIFLTGMSGIWAEKKCKKWAEFERNKKCKKWAEFERNKKCKKWAEFERNQKCKIWAEFERNQKCKKWSEFERKKMQEMIGETFRPHFCLIRGRFESWNRLNTVGKNLQLN